MLGSYLLLLFWGWLGTVNTNVGFCSFPSLTHSKPSEKKDQEKIHLGLSGHKVGALVLFLCLFTLLLESDS